MTRRWRNLSMATGLILIGAIGWLVYDALYRGDSDAVGSEPTIAVEVIPVEVGPIENTSTFASSLVARSMFTVAPKIAGRLERLAVDVGDLVERDQVVAWLDQGEFVQHVEQAEAELRVAHANLQEARSSLEAAEREFNRMRSLRDQEVASDAEMDAARSAFEISQARLRVAEAQVSQRDAARQAAQVRLSDTEIRATWPENGHAQARVVAQRFADEGTTLSANTPILQVVDLNVLRAVFHVTERDYHRLEVGQQADLTIDSLPGEVFSGTITRMSPVFRESSRQAEVLVEVPNTTGILKPGMFARVRVQFDRAEQAVIVPTSAVVRRNGQAGVFLTQDRQRVRFVPVELGIQSAGQAQVVSPTELQGEVVTLGQHLLQDNVAIIVPDEPRSLIQTAQP